MQPTPSDTPATKDDEAFCDAVGKLAAALDVNLTTLAADVTVSRTHLWRVLSGERRLNRLLALDLLNVLGKRANEILTR